MESNLISPASGNNTLHDESQFSGIAVSLSAPASAEEVSRIILACRENGDAVAVHGGLTGLNGAGTPDYAHAMSMERMNAVRYDADARTVWAQAGATFEDVEQAVRRASGGSREYPAAPSEKSATVGGALSFHSSGLRSFGYGSVADSVLEVSYCDGQGLQHTLRRGEDGFQALLASEGMCAVLTDATLSTVPVRPQLWGLMFFFASDEDAAAFADRTEKTDGATAMEYLDRAGFCLVQAYQRQAAGAPRLPEMPAGRQAAVYLELEAEREEEILAAAGQLLQIAEESGADPDTAWTAVGDEVRNFRELFHLVTESVNQKIAAYHAADARVKKLAFCARIEGLSRAQSLRLCRECLPAPVVLSGHLGGRVFCADLLPQNAAAYLEAKAALAQLYRRLQQEGACVEWNRGVGKLYRELYCDTAPIEELNRRIKAKQRFDPSGVFNPGNMFYSTMMP
jgi:glycolate oxidase